MLPRSQLIMVSSNEKTKPWHQLLLSNSLTYSSVVFKQVHKLFFNTYLFLISPTYFGTQVSSSGYAKVTRQLDVTPTTCIIDYSQLACNFSIRILPRQYLCIETFWSYKK
jgi:hypothetical protein